MKLEMNMVLCIALVTAVCGLPAAGLAQATANGDITAEVQQIPISLNQDRVLTFGAFMPFGRPGVISVVAAGAPASSDVHVVTPGDSAIWTVSGVPGAYFERTISSSTTITNGSSSMEVTGIYVPQSPAPGSGSNFLDSSGVTSFYVGATLAVGANQEPGQYSGTYEVTVAYN